MENLLPVVAYTAFLIYCLGILVWFRLFGDSKMSGVALIWPVGAIILGIFAAFPPKTE